METSAKTATILVIDDDAEIRYSLSRVLSSRGYLVSEAPSGEQGVAMVKKGPFPDLIYLDIRMTGMSGLEALQHIRSANPKQLVILMTAFGTAQTAIEAMKFGALDYVMKPFDPQRVLALAENALKTHAALRAVGEYKPTINTEDYKEGIVGSSPVMQEVFKVIGQVTASDVTVMITGESGTGKELVARSTSKAVGDMALATQTKILRVLQQGEIQRVGGTETIKVDVRIIAATNKDLEAIVKSKAFREDLYYRLNVVRIKMPPLRERTEDIPQIVDFCVQNLVKQRKARTSRVSPEAMAVLLRQTWPGNVRELENVVYRSAVVAQGDAILVKDLPPEIRGAAGESASPFALTLDGALDYVADQLGASGEPLLEQFEREIVKRVMKANNGDEAASAKRLGITKVALKKRL